MSSLQRKVARAQTKGEMIAAVKELRQTAQMWKSLYDEQVIQMSKMQDQFNETFGQAVEEIGMTKAITYMMLWRSPDKTIEIAADEITSFNEETAKDGDWDIEIDGGPDEGFKISLNWLVPEEGEGLGVPDSEIVTDEELEAEAELHLSKQEEMPFLADPDEEQRRIEEEAALTAEDDGFISEREFPDQDRGG